MPSLDPPYPPLKRGGIGIFKVPLFKGDLGGSRLGDRPQLSAYTSGCQGEMTMPKSDPP